MNMKSYVLYPNGSMVALTPQNKTHFNFSELYKAIGNNCETIELLPTKDRKNLMAVDEDGKMKNLPFNGPASQLFGDLIVGNVVICEKGMIQ